MEMPVKIITFQLYLNYIIQDVKLLDSKQCLRSNITGLESLKTFTNASTCDDILNAIKPPPPNFLLEIGF